MENSRGNSMSGTFAIQNNTEIACICDVDERAIPKADHYGMPGRKACLC